MKIHSQLIKARFEQVASDLSETISGLFWQNTTSKKFKYYDGTAVRELADTDSVQTLTNKTLTGNTAANLKPSISGLLTLPDTTDTLVGRNTTDTLINKTITSPIIASVKPDASNTLTLPVTTDTLIGRNTTDELTNKTLVTPVLKNSSTPSNPVPDHTKVYTKTNGRLYTLNSAGVENEIQSIINSQSLTGSEIDWTLGYVFHKSVTADITLTSVNEVPGKVITVIIHNDGALGLTVFPPTGVYKPSSDLTLEAGKAMSLTFIRSNSKTYMVNVTNMSNL